MPPPHPPEFRRRAVELANQRDEKGDRVTPVAQVAKDLGISDSCLRNWIRQDEIDAETESTDNLRERLAALPDPAEPFHDLTTADGRAGDVVDHALDLIRHGWEGSPDDLARQVGISRSGLYRSFASVLDLSPADWMRLRRLNRLRMRLEAEPNAVGRVGELAFEEGFAHLGRLAKSYRRVFGELPSETAKRGTGRVA